MALRRSSRGKPIEKIAHWREAGAWWEGEPEREFIQYRDAQGVIHQRERVRPSVRNELRDAGSSASVRRRYDEEWTLRQRHGRGERIGTAQDKGARNVNLVAQCRSATAPPYVPLHVVSSYSFGRSTLFAEEIPDHAAAYELPAVALTDRFSLTGVVEFAHRARQVGVKPVIGATLELEVGGSVVVIATSKRGYRSLSHLITMAHLTQPRGYPLCTYEMLETHARDLLCLTGGNSGPVDRMLALGDDTAAGERLERLIAIFGKHNLYVEIERSFLPWSIQVSKKLIAMARAYGITVVAGGAITHKSKSHFPAQDINCCIETLCEVGDLIGRKPRRHSSQLQLPTFPDRALNAEQWFLSREEMLQRFHDDPEMVVKTQSVADRCDGDVLPVRTRLPEHWTTPAYVLREVTMIGARERYGKIPMALARRLNDELSRIIRLNFATHFLVAWDLCRWAEAHGVLYSGRGSVVDSAVAYCLGLSRIDAWKHNLHFDRFLPESGEKRPDIDIDYEARRRDDVRNYMIRKYGVEHVASVAAIGRLCARGIVREVGKALGVPNEVIGPIAKRVHGSIAPDELRVALRERPELRGDSGMARRLEWICSLASDLADVPRNFRLHSSGVVLSDAPIADTVPTIWSAGESDVEDHLRMVQWDKRSCKHFFDKFDLLCLRGQDVLSGVQSRLRTSEASDSREEFCVSKLPLDDPHTYAAMRSGELIGIPQSASPAMRQAHMRLRTENLDDASLVQAGIRPGVGGAVKLNELIARRRGYKTYRFEHPQLERILGSTYGIVVFQEQVDQLLQAFCDYNSDEAEEIREAIHKRRREDYGRIIRGELMRRMKTKGFHRHIAELVCELVAGFKGYGFAQGHALAFAEVSVRSIYCQQNYPAQYFASVLDAQPAGYYGPVTLCNEARNRGVKILPLDVNRSDIPFVVEDVIAEEYGNMSVPASGIRVSLRQVLGLKAETMRRIVSNRPYRSLYEFVEKVEPAVDELKNLIVSGAFDALHPNRRALLWTVRDAVQRAKCMKGLGGLRSDCDEPVCESDIEDFSELEKALQERRVLGLDVHRHLMAFEREHVGSRGGIPTSEAKRLKHGEKAIVVGNPIRLRFPPTPSGKRVVFFDLEDETGLLNVTCFDRVYQRDGRNIVREAYVTVLGEAQDRDGHIAFLARRVFAYRPTIARRIHHAHPLPVGSSDFLCA